MEKRIIPKTKKECFAILDKNLSKEDKKAIIEAKDDIEFHFTLGMWIRNNWIYPMDEDELMGLMRQFVNEEEEDMLSIMCLEADKASLAINESYQKYLKALAKKNNK